MEKIISDAEDRNLEMMQTEETWKLKTKQNKPLKELSDSTGKKI